MSLPLACVFQCLFVISGNFCFSFVSNSSACITIPKSNYLRLKINDNIYICACFHFVLIGRNLTAQLTGSHKGIGGGIQIPERDVVVSTPSFSCPLPECPGGGLACGVKL